MNEGQFIAFGLSAADQPVSTEVCENALADGLVMSTSGAGVQACTAAISLGTPRRAMARLMF